MYEDACWDSQDIHCLQILLSNQTILSFNMVNIIL